MKFKTKFLSILVTLATVALFAITAQAQNNSYTPVSVTVPNVSGDGGVSNALAIVIDCRKQENTALSIFTTSTNTVWRISGSVDGVNYDTNKFVIGVTGAGTGGTSAIAVTNLNNSGVGYLRIDSVLNTGTRNATNTVSYGLKQYR